MMNIDSILTDLLKAELEEIPSFKQIEKLEDLLTTEGIPYEKESLYGGFHIGYPTLKKPTCSVIIHNGSYGRREGLLEIKGLLTQEELEYDEVVGFLTANEVFERIQKDWESHQDS